MAAVAPEANYPPPSQAPIERNDVSRSTSQRNRPRHSRNPSDVDPNLLAMAPPAPEVPRGPPLSYKQSPVTPTNAKSFSERLRANPREDLTGQEQWDTYDDKFPTGRSAEKYERAQPRSRRTEYDDPSTPESGPSSEPGRRRSVKQAVPRTQDARHHMDYHDLPHIETVASSKPRRQDSTSSKYKSPVTRSGSVRKPSNATDDDGRDWAPERSPLQKLELTLNGISKEEKRARVEEAEMLLRESIGRSGSRRVSQGTSTNVDRRPSQRAGNVQPPAIESNGPARSLSTSQRTASNLTGQAKPSKLVSDALAYEQAADDYPDNRAIGDSRRRAAQIDDVPASTQRHPAHDRRVVSDQLPRQQPQPVMTQGDVRRNPSTRRARVDQIEQSIPSNITRAVSQQKNMPPATFTEEPVNRSGPLREVNSSHKATLAEGAVATGAVAASNGVGRSNSRKLQKAPPKWMQNQNESRNGQVQDEPVTPPAERRVTDQTAQYYTSGAPKQIEIQRSASKRAPPVMSGAVAAAAPVGLGLDRESMEDPDHPKHHHHFSDILPHHKPRQQSVSFKQPFDRPRPVDEWKNAGTARLTLPDFNLEVDPDQPYKAWWEDGKQGSRRKSRRSSATARPYDGTRDDPKNVIFNPPLYLKCGPLLRYTGMKRQKIEKSGGRVIERETWRGSVMIVTQDDQSSYEQIPTLRLFSQPMDLLPPPPEKVNDNGELAPEYVDPLAGLATISRNGKIRYVRPIDHVEPEKDLSRVEDDDGLFENSPSPIDLPDGKSMKSPNNRIRGIDGEKVGKFREIQGHRLYADIERGVTFWRFNIEVELGDHQAHIAYRINNGAPVGFWVPARGQTMSMMFYSCNGFSLSVKPDEFSGPDPLWRDVLNTHQTRPFHCMIGGGDQIYNDKVTVETTLFADWLKIKNPHDKHQAEFTPEMAEELETFYLDRYSMWFSQGLYGMANSQIPMINIWDDHDIIDGFGSYPDHFMRTPVFRGLGNIAFKYYMLFQHQSVPEETYQDEPSWLLGADPGPYIHYRSRSLFMNLGKSVAFLGLDCRTERKRDEVMTNDTLDLVLDRCRREIVEGEQKHLIVLLGVPIAYPRLVWLENVLTSRVMDPVKALGRVGLLKGGFLNKFDGGVEILDDLDDHWTSRGHKAERADLINELQDLAAEKSVRITILGGDVHLAAIGQFYTNPKYKIPKDHDHRYMPNVISSAICNIPPGEMLADILNKRNKIHHFDEYTDEDMIPMFETDVDGKKRNNKTLLPRRNWCSIREYLPGSTPPPTPSLPSTPSESERSYSPEPAPPRRSFSFSKDGRPANLLRKLSLKGRAAPPSSYRDEMTFEPERRRPVSAGGVPMDAPGQHDYFSSQGNEPQARHSLDPQSRTAAVIPQPGNFLRRPTNLSEKAAKKGGGTLLEEGNYDDHINLESGLDIIINCEVSPKDPAGITTPYRLLVPALFYDGTSDAMHREDGEGLKRKGTLLQRIGLGGRKKNPLASNQGKGNWGQDSESGSEVMNSEPHSSQQGSPQAAPNGGYNGVEAYREKPKRRWF